MGPRVVLVSDGHFQGRGVRRGMVTWSTGSWRIWGRGRSRRPRSRAYAYDLLNFLRFLAGRDARLADVGLTGRRTCLTTWTGSSGR